MFCSERASAIVMCLSVLLAVQSCADPAARSPEELAAVIRSGEYLRWAEITRGTPHAVPPGWSPNCYAPPNDFAAQERERKRHGPHASTWIRVFVNDVGKAAFLPRRDGPFPPGTIILKEKMSGIRGPSPGFAFGAMIKHAGGAFQETGGWQFLYLERQTSWRWRDGERACSSCHATRRSTDFVFAGYQRNQTEPPE